MIALAVLIAGQYVAQPSVGFARTAAASPPLLVDPKSQFKVSFFNGTKSSVKFIGEGCSWGWDAIRFELKSPADKVFVVSRIPRPWDKNYPIPVLLESGDSALRAIDFGSKTWQGFPGGVAGQVTGWQIRVVAEVKADPALKEGHFWIGKVTSRWTPATLSE